MHELNEYNRTSEYEDTTVADIHDRIMTNIWHAESYFDGGAYGLARECLRGAWFEHVRFRDIIAVYAGPEIGDKLRAMMVDLCDDMLQEMQSTDDCHARSSTFGPTVATVAA